MAYTVPTTITAAELITVQKLNEQWIDNVAFLANPPACAVFNSGNQTLTHSVLDTITFDSERFDTNSMHSTSSNTSRITFNTAGIYVVMFACRITAGADYTRITADILLNGTTVLTQDSRIPGTDTSRDPTANLNLTYKFAVGDYIAVRVDQQNSAAADRSALAALCDFSAVWFATGN